MERFLKQRGAVFFTIRGARMLHNKLLLEAKRARAFIFFPSFIFFVLFEKHQRETDNEWETCRKGVCRRKLMAVGNVFVQLRVDK